MTPLKYHLEIPDKAEKKNLYQLLQILLTKSEESAQMKSAKKILIDPIFRLRAAP